MISGCREVDSKTLAASILHEPRHILLKYCNSHLARAMGVKELLYIRKFLVE
jgi:hypothetical protein